MGTFLGLEEIEANENKTPYLFFVCALPKFTTKIELIEVQIWKKLLLQCMRTSLICTKKLAFICLLEEEMMTSLSWFITCIRLAKQIWVDQGIVEGKYFFCPVTSKITVYWAFFMHVLVGNCLTDLSLNVSLGLKKKCWREILQSKDAVSVLFVH